MNIGLPRRYGLIIERWQIYIFKGPDLQITDPKITQHTKDRRFYMGYTSDNAKMNWFMLSVHISGWLPRIRYENIKEF